MAQPLRDTSYAREIVRAEMGDVRAKRLFLKAEKHEEIRLTWWPKGQMANRPLDLPGPELVDLLAEGFRTGVLSPVPTETDHRDGCGSTQTLNVYELLAPTRDFPETYSVKQ